MSTATAAPLAAPVRSGDALQRFESIDRAFLRWADSWHAENLQFPALISAAALCRAGYPEAFPHLLLSACHCANPAQPLTQLLQQENLAPTGWLLSPAVCYHAFAWLAGRRFAAPAAFTARGRCFRFEEEFTPGRRQVEFEMREIILVGAPGALEARLQEAQQRVNQIAQVRGISGAWETATDPFFLPAARGRQLLQRLQETKKEFIVTAPVPFPLASINRHGAFFGERFGLTLPDGSPAHTACIAFGLERWATAVDAPAPLP